MVRKLYLSEVVGHDRLLQGRQGSFPFPFLFLFLLFLCLFFLIFVLGFLVLVLVLLVCVTLSARGLLHPAARHAISAPCICTSSCVSSISAAVITVSLTTTVD